MGTRADFYGRLDSMQWRGSIAWDGYPEGLPVEVLTATAGSVYDEAVAAMLADRDDATLPSQGWPWPWPDSNTTDYAYVWDATRSRLLVSNFGRGWTEMPTADDEEPGVVELDPQFPD